MAKNASLSTMLSFLNQVWQEVIQPHFRQEEQVLIPLLPHAELKEENQSILDEHRMLEQLYQQFNSEPNTPIHLEKFVTILEKHIRFEERHFFPKIESIADTNTYQELTEKLKEVPNNCLHFTPRFWE